MGEPSSSRCDGQSTSHDISSFHTNDMYKQEEIHKMMLRKSNTIWTQNRFSHGSPLAYEEPSASRSTYFPSYDAITSNIHQQRSHPPGDVIGELLRKRHIGEVPKVPNIQSRNAVQPRLSNVPQRFSAYRSVLTGDFVHQEVYPESTDIPVLHLTEDGTYPVIPPATVRTPSLCEEHSACRELSAKPHHSAHKRGGCQQKKLESKSPTTPPSPCSELHQILDSLPETSSNASVNDQWNNQDHLTPLSLSSPSQNYSNNGFRYSTIKTALPTIKDFSNGYFTELEMDLTPPLTLLNSDGYPPNFNVDLDAEEDF